VHLKNKDILTGEEECTLAFLPLKTITISLMHLFYFEKDFDSAVVKIVLRKK